jgi:phage terminase large subunit-like protein
VAEKKPTSRKRAKTAESQAPTWSTACPDWEHRIVAGQPLIPFGPLFPAEAEDALSIFRDLHVVDMGSDSKSPTMGEVSRQWVLDLVGAIFGAYNPESGRRLIREVMLLISKKNGKSTDAAGIMMTALLKNWRQSGEMGILAPTVEVANNAYNPARDMIRADEELSDLLRVQDHKRLITHSQTGATLQVVAADSDTVAGKKWIFTLVDELWLFGKRPNAQKMLLEATGGMASRPEGFVLYLSTQSDEPPAGVFKEKLGYARKVRDGEIVDPEFLPVLYEFPAAMIESKAYLDEANWRITNPNLGASVDEAYIRRKLKEAQEGTGDTLQDVLAKHLNVEIGLNLRSDRWAGADFWEAAAIPVYTLAELLARCEVCTVGIDGGGLDDLLGLVVLGRERGTGRWLCWAHAWAHEIVLERRKEIAPALRDYQRAGDLTIVKMPGDDVAEVADLICQVRDVGLLPEKHAIGVDAAGIGDIVTELVTEGRGIEMDQIVAIRQGYSLNGAIKTTERQVAAKTLVHCGSALMNWCVSNARIEDKGNAILVTKQASGKAKIDPLMALFDAVSLMALNPTAAKKKFQFFAIG